MAGQDRSPVLGSLGMSRRDLFRRGAVLGGALVWATPTIKSLAAPAYAQTPSARDTSCCACRKPRVNGGPLCTEDLTLTDCQAFCGSERNLEAYLRGAECDSAGNCVPIT